MLATFECNNAKTVKKVTTALHTLPSKGTKQIEVMHHDIRGMNMCAETRVRLTFVVLALLL